MTELAAATAQDEEPQIPSLQYDAVPPQPDQPVQPPEPELAQPPPQLQSLEPAQQSAAGLGASASAEYDAAVSEIRGQPPPQPLRLLHVLQRLRHLVVPWLVGMTGANREE